MNWITNSVLPKIKAWVKSDSSSKNLWIKCPSCEQMLFEKDFKVEVKWTNGTTDLIEINSLNQTVTVKQR